VSGPFVRSSYEAEKLYRKARKKIPTDTHEMNFTTKHENNVTGIPPYSEKTVHPAFQVYLKGIISMFINLAKSFFTVIAFGCNTVKETFIEKR